MDKLRIFQINQTSMCRHIRTKGEVGASHI